MSVIFICLWYRTDRFLARFGLAAVSKQVEVPTRNWTITNLPPYFRLIHQPTNNMTEIQRGPTTKEKLATIVSGFDEFDTEMKRGTRVGAYISPPSSPHVNVFFRFYGIILATSRKRWVSHYWIEEWNEPLGPRIDRRNKTTYGDEQVNTNSENRQYVHNIASWWLWFCLFYFRTVVWGSACDIEHNIPCHLRETERRDLQTIGEAKRTDIEYGHVLWGPKV